MKVVTFDGTGSYSWALTQEDDTCKKHEFDLIGFDGGNCVCVNSDGRITLINHIYVTVIR